MCHMMFRASIRLRLLFASICLVTMVHGALAQSTSPAGDQQTIARGKELVAASSCAACHTAPGGTPFGGNVIGDWNAPSLLNNPHNGIAAWSADDIGLYLRTGHNAYADASGPMASVITNSTSKLSEADAAAIGVYFKSLTGSGAAARAPVAANDPAMVSGAHIYADECAACHTNEGTGAADLFPALKASPIVQADNPVTLMHVVLHGAQSVGTTAAAASAMPAFGGQLSDQQIADVLTYIRNSWGNAAPPVSADTVKKAR
jgi:mono/diheme cytochrome c family protein